MLRPSIANKILKRLQRLDEKIARLRPGQSDANILAKFNAQNYRQKIIQNINKISHEVHEAAERDARRASGNLNDAWSRRGESELAGRFGANSLNRLNRGLQLAIAQSRAQENFNAFLRTWPRYQRVFVSSVKLPRVIEENRKYQRALTQATQNIKNYLREIRTWVPCVIGAKRRFCERAWNPNTGTLALKRFSAAQEALAKIKRSPNKKSVGVQTNKSSPKRSPNKGSSPKKRNVGVQTNNGPSLKRSRSI